MTLSYLAHNINQKFDALGFETWTRDYEDMIAEGQYNGGKFFVVEICQHRDPVTMVWGYEARLFCEQDEINSVPFFKQVISLDHDEKYWYDLLVNQIDLHNNK